MRIGARPGWLLLATLACGAGVRAESLVYELQPEPDRGRLLVSLTWKTSGRTASTLCVSESWGGVPRVPALIGDVRVLGATSGRQAGACWSVKHAKGAKLECSYVVDPGSDTFDWLLIHFPITTKDFFHGIGNTFLLVPKPGDGGAPSEYEVLVRWALPAGWKAVCSWGWGRAVGMRLNVTDLRHSVYLAGRLTTAVSRVPEADELVIASVDRFGFDTQALRTLAADIIESQCKFMMEKEFPPFVVTAIPVGAASDQNRTRIAGNGLYRSLALFLPPDGGLTDSVEHLFAHETFHFWNGWQLRAAEPEAAVLWFTEGFTDYYATRLLYESGRWDADTYASWVNRNLRAYAANPAQNASNAVIRAGRRQERETVGEVPYQRGLALALRWHRLARAKGEPSGVDRLMWELVRRGRDAAFRVTNADIRAAGARLLGAWFGVEFDRYVLGAETVDVPVDALGPAFVGQLGPAYEYELGFDLERSRAERRICGLVAGSTAAQAGLHEGDRLARWTLHGDADREIMITVQRDGEARTIRYHPRRAVGREVLQFRVVAK